MITLTIVLCKLQIQIDVMVKPEQQILEVLSVLEENNKIPMGCLNGEIQIRSWRKNTYVNKLASFKMNEIQTGDILYVIGD